MKTLVLLQTAKTTVYNIDDPKGPRKSELFSTAGHISLTRSEKIYYYGPVMQKLC